MAPEQAASTAPPTSTLALPEPEERAELVHWRRLVRWQSRYPLIQIVALIVVFVWGATTIDGFSSTGSLKAMLVLAALLGLSALPQTIVVLLGGLDLSVPGFIATGAVMTTQLGGLHNWPVLAIIPAIIVVCAIGGALNGLICHRFRVQPLIVTLGMYSILQGGILIWTNADIIAAPPSSLTDWTSPIGTTFGIGVPPVVVLWAVCAIVVGIILSRTVAGRRLYATGTNPRAANLALIRTGRIWTGVFATSAILAGLTGILVAGYTSGASPAVGDPYLFQGLAAVVVGGTVLGTARGDYWRTVLGALIITELTTILVGKGFDSADNEILFGLIILVVVAGYGRTRRLRDQV